MLDSNLVFHVLIAFGAFQALFMASIILLQGPKRLAKQLFTGFLLIEGITLVERLLADTGLVESVPHLLGVSYPLSFIKAPLLFLSALSIIDPKFRLRKIHALHLIPFAIFLLLNVPFYRTFKKYTGQSPSVYFKDLQRQKNTKTVREP